MILHYALHLVERVSNIIMEVLFMYKRIVVLMLVCVLLTGCVAESTRKDIIDVLLDKGYIDSSWEFIRETETSASPIPGITAYHYTYQSDDEVFHTITIHNSKSSDDGNDSWWPIEIRNNTLEVTSTHVTVSGNENIETTVYEYRNMDSTSVTNYKVRRHSAILFSWYTVQED